MQAQKHFNNLKNNKNYTPKIGEKNEDGYKSSEHICRLSHGRLRQQSVFKFKLPPELLFLK